jgi:hypothetical protein
VFDSRAAVSADMDGDGRADLLVVELMRNDKLKGYVSRVHLMQNKLDSQNNWIGFHFSPQDKPYGLEVRLKTANKSQLLPVVTGDSFNSQHPLTCHFGLGDQSAVKRIVVRWPSGKEVRMENPKIDQYHLIQIE